MIAGLSFLNWVIIIFAVLTGLGLVFLLQLKIMQKKMMDKKNDK